MGVLKIQENVKVGGKFKKSNNLLIRVEKLDYFLPRKNFIYIYILNATHSTTPSGYRSLNDLGIFSSLNERKASQTWRLKKI